jgi:hypothetical protein
MKMALIGLLALAAACTQTAESTSLPSNSPPNTAEEATAQDTCGASHWRQYIGRAASEVDRSTLPARARVIMPGQMITMDFSAERLNIRVGPDGKVTEVGCF